MGRLEREELRVVVLNTKNVVLRVATVYQGNVSTSLVRIAELFRDAVRLERGRDHRRPQPPQRRPHAVAAMTSTSPRRRWRPGASSTSTCSTT